MMRPAWLALMVAGIVPLALHLFTRSRPPRLDWGAFRFLPPPDEARRRVVRLDQPLLLALRVAVVFLLAVAAATPTCDRRARMDAALGALDRPIFVVDLSASMSIPTDGESPLDRAAGMLDDLWRQQRFAEAAVVGCGATGLVDIYDARDPLPRSFAGVLDDHREVGGADLGACAANAVQTGRDLVVLSDTAPQPVGGAGARAIWLGVGTTRPSPNRGFGDVVVRADRDMLEIAGAVTGTGAAGAAIELRWRVPERPPVGLVADDAGRFAVQLVAPRDEARLELRLATADAAPWDDILPLWVPAAPRPEVRLVGAFPVEVERVLHDFFYAARSRLMHVAANAPGRPRERVVVVAWRPESLSSTERDRLLADVRQGSTLIAFPGASEQAAPAKTAWLPGWLHPPQAAGAAALRPGPAMHRVWPELAALNWSPAVARRIAPLADPDPGVEVLLETERGLPVLVRHYVGRGAVYLFTVEPTADGGNLPHTAVWAPLWLAMLGALDERGFEPRVVAAGSEPADLRALRRVDTAWQAAGGRAWTGWAEGRNGENEIRPVVYRVPAEEVTPGTQQGVTVLSGALRATAAPVTAEPAPRPWLLALAGLVLVQAVGSLRRAAMITVMVLAGATVLRAQDVPEFSLQLWIPQESGPTAAGIEGVRQVVAAWVDRASPAVAPQPREFAWTTEDPEDPWVWWLGCRRFDPIADAQLGKRIESFVRSGGTLWIEACGGPTEVQSLVERVDRWVRARGLGTAARRIAADHVIFRTFYLLDDWFDPDGESGLYAVAVGAVDRIWIVPNLARGLATDPLAGPQLPLAPDGREILLRQSLNLLMYTTTYDYKNDSIHLPFILERRRRHR